MTRNIINRTATGAFGRIGPLAAGLLLFVGCASTGPRVAQVSSTGQEMVIELSHDPFSLLVAKPVQEATGARTALKERKDANELMQASVAELSLLGGNDEQATSDARAMLKKDFRNVHAMRTLTKVLIKQKKYYEAIMMAENSLLVHARDSELMSLKGLAHYYNGDFYEARGAWQDSIKLDPRCVSSLMNLGSLYFANGSHQTAGTYFEKVLAHVPTHLDAQVGKALVLSALSREGEARTRLEVLIKEYPESPLVLYNLAVLERDRFQNFDKSVVYIDKYIKAVESQRDRVERAVAMREEMKVELARKNQALSDAQLRQMAQKSSQAVQDDGDKDSVEVSPVAIGNASAEAAAEAAAKGDNESIDALEEAIQ